MSLSNTSIIFTYTVAHTCQYTTPLSIHTSPPTTNTHTSSSSLCIFHLLTMTRPLIFPSCFHLSLAPYNTHYPLLEAHLLVSGLSAGVTNYWNDPLIVGNGRISLLTQTNHSYWVHPSFLQERWLFPLMWSKQFIKSFDVVKITLSLHLFLFLHNPYFI